MTLPILTDDPTTLVDPPDGLAHITATPLSPGAWAVAKAVGAVVTGLCGYRRQAGAVPSDAPLCDECDRLAGDMEVLP